MIYAAFIHLKWNQLQQGNLPVFSFCFTREILFNLTKVWVWAIEIIFSEIVTFQSDSISQKKNN